MTTALVSHSRKNILYILWNDSRILSCINEPLDVIFHLFRQQDRYFPPLFTQSYVKNVYQCCFHFSENVLRVFFVTLLSKCSTFIIPAASCLRRLKRATCAIVGSVKLQIFLFWDSYVVCRCLQMLACLCLHLTFLLFAELLWICLSSSWYHTLLRNPLLFLFLNHFLSLCIFLFGQLLTICVLVLWQMMEFQIRLTQCHTCRHLWQPWSQFYIAVLRWK